MKKTVKFLLLFMAAFLFLFCLPAHPAMAAVQSGTVDGITWKYDSSDRSLELSGSGEVTTKMIDAGWDNSTSPSTYYCRLGGVVDSSAVDRLIIDDGITNVQNLYTYIGKIEGLKALSMADTLDSSSISMLAGFRFDTLEYVYLPEAAASYSSLYTRYGASGKLTTAGPKGSGCDLEFSCSEIDIYMFMDFTTITEMTVPEGVKKIAWGALEDLPLKKLSLPASLTSMGDIPETVEYLYFAGLNINNMGNALDSAFSDSYTIGPKGSGCTIETGNYTTIPEGFGGDRLQKIIFPATLTSIEANAFEECEDLTSVEFAAGTNVTIGEQAFYRCPALKSVKFGAGSTAVIGQEAFCECSALKSLDLPAGELGTYAFRECESLSSVTMEKGCRLSGQDIFYDCCELTEITLPEDLTVIGEMALKGCTALKSVTLPDTLTTIESKAFNGCTDLTNIEFPASLTTIGEDAFLDCSSLLSVEIPCTVTELTACGIGLEKSYGYGGLNGYFGYAMSDAVIRTPRLSKAWLYAKSCGIQVEETTADTAFVVDSGSCGDSLTWSLSNSGKLTISGTGAMPDYSDEYTVQYIANVNTHLQKNTNVYTNAAPWHEYASAITSVKLNEGITKIGAFAFDGTQITSVKMPSTLKTVGESAFAGSTLKKADFSLANDVKLEKAALATDSLTTVTGSVDFGDPADGVISEDSACWSTVYDVEANYENDFLVIGGKAYKYRGTGSVVRFPESVTEIPAGILGKKNETVTTIYLPKNLTSLPAFCFFNCLNLRDIYIYDKVTSIGKMAVGWYEYSDFYSGGKGYTQQPLTIHGKSGTEAEAYCTRVYDKSVGWENHFTFCDINIIDLTATGKITLSYTSSVYSGSNKTPTVKVTADGKTLTSGTDYTVVYDNNKNVGTATVTVTGKGKYTGTLTRTFKITAASGAKCTCTLASTSAVYTGSAIKPAVTVKTASGKTLSSSNYKISYKNNTSVGTATVTVTFRNNYSGTQTLTFTIVPKTTSFSSVTNGSTGIILKWSKNTKAGGYKIYRKTGTTGEYKLIKTITTNATTSYTDTKASTNGTKYTYKIMAFKGDLCAAKSSAKTMYRLTRPTISSLTAATKAFTVKYGKNTKATGYQVSYALNSSFTDSKTKSVTGASTLSCKVSSLTKGKKYYVRVRSYKTVNSVKYYSAWSGWKSVTAK